jgi:hypothetical protein
VLLSGIKGSSVAEVFAKHASIKELAGICQPVAGQRQKIMGG